MRFANFLVIFSIFFSLNLLITFANQEGDFGIEFIGQNEHNNEYDIEIRIENKNQKKENYKIEILYENTNLVVGSKTITCSDICQDSIKLKKVLFGNHRIEITPKSSRGKITKTLHFNLEHKKEEFYKTILKPVYYVEEGSNQVPIRGKIETKIEKETRYIFEYYPLSEPRLRKESSVLCKESCDFSFFLEAPFIIDTYQVNIYSILGEQQNNFRLDIKKNKTSEIIIDSKNKSVNAKITYIKNNIIVNESQTIGELINIEFDLSQIKNETKGVKSILIENAIAQEISIGFEYINKTKAQEEFNSEVINAFAINPIVNPEVESYNLTFIASSNALYKCKDYDFANQNCFGTFTKVIDTKPGIEYTITLTPEDPLFVEIPVETFNVEHNTIVSTATTFSDTVSPVIPNETLILFRSRTSDSNPNDWQYTVNLTNSTNIDFQRYAGGGSSTNISYQLIESNKFFVQRSIESFTIGTDSQTIQLQTPINTSESFGVAYGRCDSATTNNNHAGFFLIEILNSTHINLERGQGTLCAATVSWQVVEFEGATVQSDRISYTSTGTIISDTITAVNTQESFLIFGISASSGTDRGMETNYAYGELTSSTNVQFTRDADVGTSDRDIFYYVVEHPQINVQRNSFSSAADTTQTISSVNTSRSFHTSSTTNTGGGQTYQNNAHTYTLLDSTSLFFDKETPSQTITTAYEVIEFTPVVFSLINQVNLTSSSGFNLTSDTLICSYNLASDARTAGVSWFVDDTPLMLLNIPVEGGSSDSLTDLSGNSNNLTCSICPLFNVSGGFDGNGSFEFVGTNYLNTSSQVIDPSVGNWSIATWFKVNNIPSSGNYNLIQQADGIGTGRTIMYVTNTGELTTFLGGSAKSSGVSISSNQWYHSSLTWNGSNLKWYVNGNLENNYSFIMESATGHMIFGTHKSLSSGFLQGTLDEIKFYNRSLSNEQITAIFENRTNEIVSQETLGAQIWQCRATPYSQTLIGPTYYSNNITISTNYEFLNLTQIIPTEDISVYQYQPFNITINASCDGTLDCDPFNISIYYEEVDAIGEAGTLSTSGTTQNTVIFQNRYNETPIVVAISGSNNNADNNPLIPIIHGITQTHMNISLCQDAGLTTCSSSYTAEDIHYLVIDKAKASTYSWIDVGNLSANTGGGSTAFTFSNTFSNTPYLFGLPQTYNLGSSNIAAHNWFTSITTTGANLIACDHPGTGNTCGGGASENFGYIAIDPVLIDFAKSNLGTESISNSDWTTVSYGQSYNAPVVIVGVNSETGAQDPAYPLARSVTTTGADIRYCEVDGANDCDTHSAEDTRWLSLEEGLIQVTNAGYINYQITNTTDAIPFYIQGIDTVYSNLSSNESTLFNFEIIPTGFANSTYTLFGETSAGTSSQRFNVTILESTFNITLNEPTYNPFSVIQNNTFELNITINCNGFCSGNFSATALYTSNISIEGDENEIDIQAIEINNSQDSPFFTLNLQPQICSTPINGECTLSWQINSTGNYFTQHLVGVRVISDSLGSELSSFPRTTIIDRQRIIINQSEINFSVLTNYQGDTNTIDFTTYGGGGAHNNISYTCLSGDCSVFSDTFIDGTNYDFDTESSFSSSCYAITPGNFSAIFRMVSNEDLIGDNITLNCISTELQLYINLVDPDTTLIYNALFNSTYNITFNVTCNQVGGCNNVFVSLAKQRERIGEVGRVSLANYNEEQITFTQTYSQAPIVIATPSTNNQADNNALIPVVYNVTTTGFNIRLCQDAGATTCSTTLSSESIDYMVFNRVKVENLSWIDVGEISALSNGADTQINFGKTFSSAPYVFAQAQTNNDGGSAIAPTSWAHTITTSTAQLIACDHPGTVDACAGSTTETYGYVAIDITSVNLSLFDSGTESISNSAWTSITFTQNYSTPIVAVLQNSDTGAQDPQYPWARNIDFSGGQIRYCEQDGTNDCDGHAAETVIWMSLEEGPIEIGTQEELVSSIPGTQPTYSLTQNPMNFNLTFNETLSIIFTLNATGALEELFNLYGFLNNGIESQSLDIRIVYYLIVLELQKEIYRVTSNTFNLSLNLNSFSEYGTPPNQEILVNIFLPEAISLLETFIYKNSTQHSTILNSENINYKGINGTIYSLEISNIISGEGTFNIYEGFSDSTNSWQTNFTISNENVSNILEKILIGFDPRPQSIKNE